MIYPSTDLSIADEARLAALDPATKRILVAWLLATVAEMEKAFDPDAALDAALARAGLWP